MLEIKANGTTPKMEDLTVKELAWLESMGHRTAHRLTAEHCTYPPLFCLLNVIHYCDQNPDAEIVNGWVLWRSAAITELEFHAVVRVDGVLRDITKRVDRESEVLFFEEKRYWAKFDKGMTHSFYNILYPKIARKRKATLSFDPDRSYMVQSFRNFPIKGSPRLNGDQRAFVNLTLEILNGNRSNDSVYQGTQP